MYSRNVRGRRGMKMYSPNVTIVCGPPGSGKTTFVMDRKEKGDIVVDIDWLWMALTGLDYYDKPDHLVPFVLDVRKMIIERLQLEGSDTTPILHNVWIISGSPNAIERKELQYKFPSSRVIVLEQSVEQCMENIRQDQRREGKSIPWEQLVKKWWVEYTPRDGEQVIKHEKVGG